MRITVMGSGGVGGYFGARLAKAGHDVTFIARGEHLAAMRRSGLRIESPRCDLHLQDVQVTDNPAEAGPSDLVLFGVKLWDTQSAAAAIKPLMGNDTAVVSFQNGVVKDELLSKELGSHHVMGGVCYIAATIAEPGVIRHSGVMQKLVFGEYGPGRSDRASRFRDACADADIDAELSAHIRKAIWQKFVFLVGLSGATSTVRTPIGPIRQTKRSRALLRGLMDEVVQVARGQGVDLPADFADDRLAFCDQVPATMTSSMHHDLDRGSRLEVQWLSGDVVARGERMGIPTPYNTAVFDILSVHAEGRAA